MARELKCELAERSGAETVPGGLPAVENWDAGSAVGVPPATAALWAILATVLMLFAGFSSAYLVRREAPDWIAVYAPPLLWFNTAILLFSSLALEGAKSMRKLARHGSFRVWMLSATGLGLVFLAAQWVAWKELRAEGIFLPTSPHSSFFFLLTGVHAFHVLGGLAALFYVLAGNWRKLTVTRAAGDTVNLCAIYWHFVAGIWVYLYLLLFVWR